MHRYISVVMVFCLLLNVLSFSSFAEGTEDSMEIIDYNTVIVDEEDTAIFADEQGNFNDDMGSIDDDFPIIEGDDDTDDFIEDSLDDSFEAGECDGMDDSVEFSDNEFVDEVEDIDEEYEVPTLPDEAEDDTPTFEDSMDDSVGETIEEQKTEEKVEKQTTEKAKKTENETTEETSSVTVKKAKEVVVEVKKTEDTTVYDEEDTEEFTEEELKKAEEEDEEEASLIKEKKEFKDERIVVSLTGREVLTPIQEEMLSKLGNVPYAGSGYCARYVSWIYRTVGLRIWGHAKDMWANYCDTDINDVKPGMIVAVRTSGSGTSLGAIYGHVGVYIGGGMIIHNSISKHVMSLQDWIDRYDVAGTVKCGFPSEMENLVTSQRVEMIKTSTLAVRESLQNTLTQGQIINIEIQRQDDAILKELIEEYNKVLLFDMG